MKKLALIAALAFLSIPMAGCFDFLQGDDVDPRTYEFTLEVGSSTTTTIPLYTLNDGRQMNVVAIGFTAPGQEQLRVPNPEIRVKEGDTIILHVLNNNPLPHTFHFHGGLIPWEMDGVPYLTQMPIHQGQEYTYVFEDLKAGTYFYHCHVDVAHHVDLGMYGAFIVEEREPKHAFQREYVLMLDEWDNCHVHGNTDPLTGTENSGEFSNRIGCLERFLQDNLAQNLIVSNTVSQLPIDPARPAICDTYDGLPEGEAKAAIEPIVRQFNCEGGHATAPPQQDIRTWWPETHPVYAPIYNTFLINGKAFPDTLPLPVREGETVKLRLIHVGEEMHSMHIHGHKMLVTHRDGYLLQSPFYVDTLGIMPGERYDVVIEMDNPGFWMFHDHVGLNSMNDDHDPGGMMTCIAYDGFHGYDAFGFERSLDCSTAAIEIFGGHGGHQGGRSGAGRVTSLR